MTSRESPTLSKRAHALSNDASFQAFANCYLREIDAGKWIDGETWTKKSGIELTCRERHVVELMLSGSNKRLALGVRFRSHAGRHVLTDIYVNSGEIGTWQALDRISAQLLLIDSIYAERTEDEHRIELIARLLESHRVMADYVSSALLAADDGSAKEHLSFIQSEQSTVFGHWLHPTPKSRQGFLSWHHDHYAPEMGGRFQLHFFAVASQLISQVSLADVTAEEIARRIARCGESTAQTLRDLGPDSGYCLLPVHPLQAQWLLHQSHVLRMIESGEVRDLGRLGAFFTATSSVRTVYSEQLDFMVKLSIPVKLTNSLRLNLRTELDDSVWVSKLCRALRLRSRYPTLHILEDPAYLSLDLPGLQESGFEIIFRENPFVEELATQANVHSIAALVQEPVVSGRPSILAQLIKRVAAALDLPEHQAALLWFESYFKHAIITPIELLDHHGIALEAHQQNALLEFDARGLPVRSFYRDIQGLSLLKSRRAELTAIVPELAQLPKIFEPDEIVQHGFGYYLFFNQLYSVVNRLAIDSFLDEAILLDLITAKLKALRTGMVGSGVIFINAMLSMEAIPCKANLLTRVADVDELEEENELGVYTLLPNPLLAATRTALMSDLPAVLHFQTLGTT